MFVVAAGIKTKKETGIVTLLLMWKSTPLMERSFSTAQYGT